jgi:hypothetical protein
VIPGPFKSPHAHTKRVELSINVHGKPHAVNEQAQSTPSPTYVSRQSNARPQTMRRTSHTSKTVTSDEQEKEVMSDESRVMSAKR